jgi:hypothetical protein
MLMVCHVHPSASDSLPYLACLLVLPFTLADQHHDGYPASAIEMPDKEGLEAW